MARKFLIRGGVQGVGYRFFAQRAAAKHTGMGLCVRAGWKRRSARRGSATNVEAFKNDCLLVAVGLVEQLRKISLSDRNV